MDLIPMPAALLTSLLLPLRGQESRQKQVGIGQVIRFLTRPPHQCPKSVIRPGHLITSVFGGAGDLQQLGLAEVGTEDLQADGEVVAAVEVGGAAGHRDAGDAGEVGRQGENIR